MMRFNKLPQLLQPKFAPPVPFSLEGEGLGMRVAMSV